MKTDKVKMTLGDKEIVGTGRFSIGTEIMEAQEIGKLNEIEQFILEAGSDHLPTFGGRFEGGIQCQQISDELAPCIKTILDSGEPINNYLEIGAAAGGSAYIIHHYFNPRTIVLIDDNQHPKAHIRPYILRDIPHEEIIGNSHNQSTIVSLRRLGVLFDAILIDGDHLYDGAKMDVENYYDFLRPGGFLIFHDSQIGQEPYGCKLVAEETKQDIDRWTLVDEYISKTGKVCGICLFRKVEE